MLVFCDRLVTVLTSHRKILWFVVCFPLSPSRLQVAGHWKVEVGIWIQGKAASWTTTPVRSSMLWPRPSCLTLSSCNRDWLYWRCWPTTGIQGNTLVPMHYNKTFPSLLGAWWYQPQCSFANLGRWSWLPGKEMFYSSWEDVLSGWSLKSQ